MMMLETLFWLSTAAVVHHHVTYPLSLLALEPAKKPSAVGGELPAMTIIVPAYREAATIATKVANLAALDYPADRLHVRIVCDGSPDKTPEIARAAVAALGAAGTHMSVIDHGENRGKVAILNEEIALCTSPVAVLTDASAELPVDALMRVAAAMTNPAIGVVGGLYDCNANGSAGEKSYWSLQNRLRLGEAALGGPMGFSGAFYAIRRDAFRPLAADTINDDFVLPMEIIADGWNAVLDPELVVTETERTRPGQERARRIRIGAGNMQQSLRLWRLLNPLRPGIAYAFASGKGLRAFIPFLIAFMIVSAAILSFSSLAYATMSLAMGFSVAYALAAMSVTEHRRNRFQALAATMANGYIANGTGSFAWLTGRFDARGRWASATQTAEMVHVPASVRFAKRIFDLAGAAALLSVLSIVFVPVALAIRLESPGPVFYRQLRVGRALADRTTLFELIKFRTMRNDAEKNGAAWATKGDARITRVGAFLRKTRLDELPQAINILRGEMSLIGPRPERPVFFAKLEGEIPLYIERTYGILPGVTGLAQVKQGYDESIEDVRSKVAWDHAYALQLESFWTWLKADFPIALATVGVMVGRKGQ